MNPRQQSHTTTRALAELIFFATIALPTSSVLAATLTAEAHMIDSFLTAPNIDNTQSATVNGLGLPVPSVRATAHDPETGAGGSAFAKGGFTGGDTPHVVLGTQASARSQGNRVGSAHATGSINYRVEVDIHIDAGDPMTQALIRETCTFGCQLATDFLHQTSGRLFDDFTQGLGAAGSARFSEELAIVNGSVIAGQAFVARDQVFPGNAFKFGATGSWSRDDFVSENSIGETVELIFNHFAKIPDQVTTFGLDHSAAGLNLNGAYDMTLTQSADADFGTAGYIFGTYEADFAHTSTFSFERVHDPLGRFDLSGATASVHFTDIDAVPLPPAIALMISGIALLRRRMTTNTTAGKALA